MHGFSVMLDPTLDEAAAASLDEDLGKVRAMLLKRTGALEAVQSSCHIWVNRDNGAAGACAHWVEKAFADPLGRVEPRPLAVEVNNWHHYNSFLLRREGVMLHELAHVYNGTLGRDHAPVVAMHERARRSGKYEEVAVSNGARAVAYGLQNHLEFFASLSVAFLGGSNDYEPFTRDGLREFDTASFDALESIWGAPSSLPRTQTQGVGRRAELACKRRQSSAPPRGRLCACSTEAAVRLQEAFRRCVL